MRKKYGDNGENSGVESKLSPALIVEIETMVINNQDNIEDIYDMSDVELSDIIEKKFGEIVGDSNQDIEEFIKNNK